VRNGYHQPREALTAARAVEVKAQPVNDKRVDRDRLHQNLRLLVMLGVRARLRSPVSGASARHNRSACSNRGHRRPPQPHQSHALWGSCRAAKR
jgi:hypothetical protein